MIGEGSYQTAQTAQTAVAAHSFQVYGVAVLYLSSVTGQCWASGSQLVGTWISIRRGTRELLDERRTAVGF